MSNSYSADFGLNIAKKLSFQGSDNRFGRQSKSSGSLGIGSRASGDKSTLYISDDLLLGGREVYWTNLCHYQEDRQEQIKDIQLKYKRTCRAKDTLVFEPYNLFFKVYDQDVQDQELSMDSLIRDSLIRQFMVDIEGSASLFTIKLWPQGLIPKIKKLARHYELIIFSVLPRKIITELINMHLSELKDCFSFVLGNEDLTMFEGHNKAFKDIGLLACNRMDNQESPGELFVIDTCDFESSVDQDLITFLPAKVYGCDLKHTNLDEIIVGLKNYREQD